MTLTILNTCNRNESRPIEQNKLQLDTNSKCFSLECKMTLNEIIGLFVLCPTAYTNSSKFSLCTIASPRRVQLHLLPDESRASHKIDVF